MAYYRSLFPPSLPLPTPSPSRFCPHSHSRPRFRSRLRLMFPLPSPFPFPPLPRHRPHPRRCSLFPVPGIWFSHNVLARAPGLATLAAGCLQASSPVCRDGVACGMTEPVVKEKKMPPETSLSLPLHQVPKLVGLYIRTVLHPFDGQIFSNGLNLWTSLAQIDQAKGMRQ